MSAVVGANIPNDNFALAISVDNVKTLEGRSSNILETNFPAWTIGTGSATGYGQNGDGNSRIIDTNPWGYSDIVWDVSNQDATSDADGGWDTSVFQIDSTKKYRYSVWVRRKNVTSATGNTYLGPRLYDASVALTSATDSVTGGTTTNPYFYSGDLWSESFFTLNEWYLIVGHMLPTGSPTSGMDADSGIWTTDGVKQREVYRDYIWSATTTQALHRSYLYYETGTATNQQFYQPRVDLCDGTEPTLAELLEGKENTADALGTSIVTKQKVSAEEDGFSFVGSTDDSSMVVPLDNFNKQEGTISCWIYPTGYSGSNGIFVNRDTSTSNALDWLWLGVWSSGSILYLRLGNGAACCNQDLTISSFSTNHAPVNTWTHVTATWKENGTSVIYINGEQVGSRSIFAVPNTNPSTTGRIGLGHGSGGTGSWNGKINDFFIHKTQLSASDVKKIYVATRRKYS